MGTTYSAKVFFGARVPASDPFAKILDACINRDGGTPAKTEIDGVVIGISGNMMSSDKFYTIEAKCSTRSFDRYDEIAAPAVLQYKDAWVASVGVFLEKHGVNDRVIGWHFAGSAS